MKLYIYTLKSGYYINHFAKERFFVTFKKSLSVFLAFVMLISVFSLGLTGIAASIDYNTQYDDLAAALKNEHVRDLTNYTIENKALEATSGNVIKGFNTEAKGFVYDHRVIAADNAAGDILKAANIFYFIAESLMSTTYNEGKYNATLLIEEIAKNLKTKFNPTGSENEKYYEDFYGKLYEPDEDELAAYNEAVELITAAGREVTQASLTEFRVFFMEKDNYEYYNVDTILKYFMGNNVKINAGNWYHRNAFIVKTSKEAAIMDLCRDGGVNNATDTTIITRTAVYEIAYTRTFIEENTKAVYAFKAPSASSAFTHYGAELGITELVSANLAADTNIHAKVQANGLLVKIEKDSKTITDLQEFRSLFTPYINKTMENGKTWDAQFAAMNETQLRANVPEAEAIVSGFDKLADTYSNEALMTMFGDDIGDMVTLVYILKPISKSPTRTVRGTATYTATADKLNAIVRDMDALVYDDTSDTSKRVGTIVKQFFNTNNSLFEGTAVAGMDFDNLHDLVGLLLNGLVFNDNIINTLVNLLYPLVTDLLSEEVIGAVKDIPVIGGLAGTVSSLINLILENNELAIYPKQLGERLEDTYKDGRYAKAIGVLKAGGDDWTTVNFDALHWGVDDAPLDKKAEVFTNALCAALGGFRLLLITVMCGDAEYQNDDRKAKLSWASKNQFTEFYDKLLVNIGQDIALLLRSQGAYTKLIVPLFRVLGIPEMPDPQNYNGTHNIYGYFSSKAYHKYVDYDGDNCLRLIIEPIVYWATHILAEKPFETIWNLVPNLVYFFTRQSNIAIADDWTDTASTVETHDNFTTCQTHSLAEIMDHVHVQITALGFDVYSSSIAGFLGDTMNMLGSVNGLLNEVLKLEYIVGESGVLNTVAYANNEGVAVMPDSYEYVTNSEAYPHKLQYVYANENETEYRANPDDVHYKEITNPEYIKATYKIPALQEAKLTSVTTLNTDGTLADPNAIGILNTDWNTIDVKNPGVVLMYVLRYVLSALGYKYDISESAVDPALPFLIECFGLDIDTELFQGLNLKDIIFNVMLHPDAAICALLELFYSNEKGNYYNSVAYTYPLTPIDYHEDVLTDKAVNPDLTYGTAVRYSKYWTREYATSTLDNLDDLATNVLKILTDGDVIELDGFENGLTGFLQNLLNENVFNNKLMNTLFNTIYQLLGGLNDTVGFDIEAILDAALNIHYDPGTIGRTIEAMMGEETPASRTIKNARSWNALFTAYTETDPETGEETPVIADVDLDWGIDTAEKPHYAFLKTAAALLAPASFAIRFLFMDQHLDILGLIDIDAYAGYQYAFIGLLEALSCPGILTYKQYYEKGQAVKADTLLGDANTIYYLLEPVLKLVDEIYLDPLTTALGLIPNLLFFISIGGLNDLVNNLVHFAYVLLDILKPIVNGYDLLSGLLSNINISGFILNLSLPLDLDFNSIISELLDALVGSSLEISGVRISLPYIDFHTLCCGILDDDFMSQEVRRTTRLDSAGGADLITALFRLVFEVVYMDENQEAVGQIIRNAIDNGKVDDFDGETLAAVLSKAFDLVEEYEVLDMALFLIYFLVDKITPLSQTIIDKDIKVVEFIKNFDINKPESIVELLTKLISDGEEAEPNPTEVVIPQATKSIWERIKAFFERIINFFKGLFS